MRGCASSQFRFFKDWYCSYLVKQTQVPNFPKLSLISTNLSVKFKWQPNGLTKAPNLKQNYRCCSNYVRSSANSKRTFHSFLATNRCFRFRIKNRLEMSGRKKPSLARTEKVSGTQKSGNFFSVSDETSRDEVVRDWQAIAKIVLTRITETLRSEHIDAYTFMNRIGRFYNMTDMTFTDKLAGSKIDSQTKQIFTRTSNPSGKWWEKATGITRPNNVCLTIFMDGVKLASNDPFIVMNSHHAYETYIRVFIEQQQMEKNSLA